MKRLICLTAVLAVGCSTASKDITASYASPLPYQGYNCEQLAAENARIEARAMQLGNRLDQASRNDKGLVVVGALLFWPALFALGGTREQEAEYARLKGEHDALQQSQIAKGCLGNVAATHPAAQPAAAGGTAATEGAPTPMF